MDNVIELGAVGMAVLAIIMLVDFIRKKYGSEKSGAYHAPLVCPNKVEGLGATLKEMSIQAAAQTNTLLSMMHVMEESAAGIQRLVEQHRPNSDGREMWKTTRRAEQIQEETRDLMRELVRIARRNWNGGL